MAPNRCICLNKPFQSLKMPWLCLRTFSGNSSTLDSNCGYSSISLLSTLPLPSAWNGQWPSSSVNQNLIGPLDSPPLDSSYLLNFLVELETDWGFGGTLSSGVDGKTSRACHDIRPALNCILTFYEKINITFYMSRINQFFIHFQRKIREISDSPTVQTWIASWCRSYGVIIFHEEYTDHKNGDSKTWMRLSHWFVHGHDWDCTTVRSKYDILFSCIQMSCCPRHHIL